MIASTRHLFAIRNFISIGRKEADSREENRPLEVSQNASLVYSARCGLNLLDHRPSFVASSSLTSLPTRMAIERDSRDGTFFFCISRGSARLALARQTRGHHGPVPFHWIVSVNGEQYGGEKDQRGRANRRCKRKKERVGAEPPNPAAASKLCRLFRTVGL